MVNCDLQRMSHANKEPRPCQECSEPMALVSSVPRLSHMPELHTYKCGSCGNVETIEIPSE
jgi:hypothetical protein